MLYKKNHIIQYLGKISYMEFLTMTHTLKNVYVIQR